MIFNLFKSKPTLKELIPEGFVDIHSHILPGIDDGAKNIDESIELISEMKKLGFSKIIGTPHIWEGMYENNHSTISDALYMVKKKNKKNIDISISGEYMINKSILDQVKSKSILTIKDNFILIEFGFQGKPYNLDDFIFELRMSEYIPIIAHPERYLYFNNSDLSDLKKLKQMGCKFQMNLFSITNYYGRNVLKFSDRLLKNKLIDFVGSDIHGLSQLKEFDKKIMINSIKEIEKSIQKNIKYFS